MTAILRDTHSSCSEPGRALGTGFCLFFHELIPRLPQQTQADGHMGMRPRGCRHHSDVLPVGTLSPGLPGGKDPGQPGREDPPQQACPLRPGQSSCGPFPALGERAEPALLPALALRVGVQVSSNTASCSPSTCSCWLGRPPRTSVCSQGPHEQLTVCWQLTSSPE